MRSLWFTLCTVLGLGLPGFANANSGAAVFGSFADESRAMSLSRDVANQLSIRTRVVAVEVNGRLFFRVSSLPQPEGRARDIIRVAKNRGYQESWYSPEKLLPSSKPDSQPSAAPESLPTNLTSRQTLAAQIPPKTADSENPNPQIKQTSFETQT